MNPTTESRLWIEIQTGNLTVKHDMIQDHLGLVFKQANKRGENYSFERRQDLIGVGSLGLCLAAESYAASMANSGGERPGCKFSTFAHQRINSKMVFLERTDGIVPQSEYRTRVHTGSLKKWDAMTTELGRNPSHGEFRERYGPTVAKALQPTRYLSLDNSPVELAALSE